MKRILVADDDSDMRELLCAHLKQAGHQFEQASDGVEALRRQRSAACDIAVVDIFMPEKDGLETIAAFRREFPQTPILAISGGGTLPPSPWLELARVLGANETLEKPFSSEQFLTSIAALLPPVPL